MANNTITTIIPQGTTTDVSMSQNVITGGLLIFNGVTGGNFINNGYMRTLSFTSTNDLSAVFFEVNGYQNGAPITETVSGPNNGTVYSTRYFDYVTSITSSAGAMAISVGSGSTSYIFYNAAANGFNSSRFSVPYMMLSIYNPYGDVTTRVDGLVNFPAFISNWTPGSLVANTYGTFSVKAPDNLIEYKMIAADTQLYSGYIVTVEGFPSANVYVNIVQP